ARGDRRAGRDLSFRGRLSPGERPTRSGGYRSRPDPTQEHRRADRSLFIASRRLRPGEILATSEAARAESFAARIEEAFGADAARRGDRGVAHSDRGRDMVFVRREPT